MVNKPEIVEIVRSTLSAWNDVINGGVKRVVAGKIAVDGIAADLAHPAVTVPDGFLFLLPLLRTPVERMRHFSCHPKTRFRCLSVGVRARALSIE